MSTSTHPRHLLRKVLTQSPAAVTIRDGDITIDGDLVLPDVYATVPYSGRLRVPDTDWSVFFSDSDGDVLFDSAEGLSDDELDEMIANNGTYAIVTVEDDDGTPTPGGIGWTIVVLND